MADSSPKLVNVMYDLDLWQARAIKSGSLEGFLVPTTFLADSRAAYNDGVLLCLREPFYTTGGGHGEQGFFLYQADGKVNVPPYGSEKVNRRLEPDEWFPASGMHPTHIRFFMNVWSPPESGSPAVMAEHLTQLGLISRGKGKLVDQLNAFWNERYHKDYFKEDAVSFLEGELLGPYRKK
ncbi:MAG: hypothetical protein Q7K45_06130 [Nanoarchaeota archaeon]|nr:hypothetical protein [Nanoarchaeota archaeon]